MSKAYIGSRKKGRLPVPLTRAEILEAQKHTKSNRAASLYLKVGYIRYRRYAKIYKLFDSHANPTGIGTSKGYATKPSTVPLRDIFANKHPKYSLSRLKNRLIARNIVMETCAMCGFGEKRITDSKTPLIVTFKNGVKDFAKDNLQLLCYNCLFLTTNSPPVAYKGYITKSFESPEEIPERWDVAFRKADAIEVNESNVDADPSTEEYLNIRDEVLKEISETRDDRRDNDRHSPRII